MSVAGQKCCKRVFTQYTNHVCDRTAKFEHDGKFYCGTHDPVRLGALNEKNRADWQREHDAKNAAFTAQQAKIKLNAAKAELFDEAIATVMALGSAGCWCEMAIGHPNYSSHTSACLRAQNLIETAGKL